MSDQAPAGGKRQMILAAAYKVFEAHGYAAARVGQIAAAAGVAKGSVYNYFGSKQAVFGELFAEQLAADEAEMDRIVADQTSAVAKIQRYMELWFTRSGEYQRIGALTLEFWAAAARGDGAGQMNEMLVETYDRWRERIGAIIAQGVESGEFRSDLDPARTAAFIMGTMDGLTVHAIMGMGATIDDAFLVAMKRGTLLALGAGPQTDDTAQRRDENQRPFDNEAPELMDSNAKDTSIDEQ